MKRKWKRELGEVFWAPPAKRKEEFFQSLELPGISFWEFLRLQIPYIRKWNWCIAVILFGMALAGGRWLDETAVWAAGALTPFLALTAAVESRRSVRCGMEELELSCRFSLKTVVFSRLFILGIGNLVILITLILASMGTTSSDLAYTGTIILFPYLLTSFLDFSLMRKIHRQEGLYVCVAVTALVSVGDLLGSVVLNLTPVFFRQENAFWGIVILLVLTAREYMKIVKQSEEYVWN